MAHNITVVYDLTPDDVTCGTHTNGRRGHVDLGPDVTIHGTIAELRAVAVEIDRQLARLEVEHRVDQAVTKCGTCGDTGEVIGSGPFHYAVHPCPACKEGDQ